MADDRLTQPEADTIAMAFSEAVLWVLSREGHEGDTVATPSLDDAEGLAKLARFPQVSEIARLGLALVDNERSRSFFELNEERSEGLIDGVQIACLGLARALDALSMTITDTPT